MTEKNIRMICTDCPRGCCLEIAEFGVGDELEITGNLCPKGEAYALRELINPMRTITTTVKTSYRDFPRLPVKTDGPVPLKDIFKFMTVINKILQTNPTKPGDLIKENLLDSNINLIATAEFQKEKRETTDNTDKREKK
ncbi:MAG: DUF1667 domain-containing protein [bacterium]|nr:DUF1667 domain-containing protein [bacterium]